MASIRQRIVDAVVARLDGAGKPAGLAVHRSRGISIDQDELPAMVVYLLAQRTQRVGGRAGPLSAPRPAPRPVHAHFAHPRPPVHG